MERWQNFILQKMGRDESNVPYPIYESVSHWGIWCKSIPFTIFTNVKEPAKSSWYDEDGDEEYIPSETGLKLEAYSIEVEFACKKTKDGEEGVRERVGIFLEWLRKAGFMKMYSTWTRIGRQEVRFSSVKESATWKKTINGTEFLIFTVKFKVNDPVTDVVLSIK